MQLSDEISRRVTRVKAAIEEARIKTPCLDHGLSNVGNVVEIKLDLPEEEISITLPIYIYNRPSESKEETTIEKGDTPEGSGNWGSSKTI